MTQRISETDRDEARRLEIEKSLRLLIEPGQVAELRALNVPRTKNWKCPMMGYFDSEHLDVMAREATRLTMGGATGVYFTLNPVQPDLLARATNRIREAKAGEAATDADIVRRKWLLIDVDPLRVKGVSATDKEKTHAREVLDSVWAHLFECRWPEGIIGDSGNGWHGLFRIDLPADDGGLVKRVLQSLASQFNNEHATIDVSVFNPSRICKVPGTMARKGDHVQGTRPWRWSGLEYIPDLPLEIVSAESLEAVASQATPGKSSATATNAVVSLLSSPADRHIIIKRARSYLAKLPPAIQSQDGSGAAIHAACELFRFGLTDSEARSVFDEFNGRCVPPWNDHEIVHKLESARDKVVKAGEFGCRLNEERSQSRSMSPAGGSNAVPTRTEQRSATIILSAGTRVRAKDRDNFGEVVRDDGGDTVAVHFVSPSGDEATVSLPREQLLLSNGSPVVPSGFELRVITSAEFSATSYRRHFLVRRVLAEGQCCMIGGPKKALKTSIVCDLALSLGTGTPFLSQPDFSVPDIVPTAVLSGESGGFTLQETARRIALARGRLLTSAQVFWGFELPKLARQDHLDALAKMIRDNGVKVCFVDPAYLCLMGGPSEANLASNVFAMGSLLSGLSDVGRDTESTIVLVHHTRKQDRTKPFEVPELDDLAFAGFGEWARQWLLLNRRERYDGESGEHRLWLNVGGSAGHSGTWALDIREGTVTDDRSERTWAVSVIKAADVIERNQQEREQRREQKKADELQRDAEKVLSVMGNTPQAQSVIRDKAKLSTGRTKTAIDWLMESGKARHEEYVAGNRTFLGVCLSESSGSPGLSGIPDGIPDESSIRDASLSLERRSIPDGSGVSPIESETEQHPGWSDSSNDNEGELEWVA